MNKPLISLTMGSYNQESYVQEALESAFAQTYSPLEIVLSDDCSKDRTFEIAQKVVARYKGPHSVKLNRNEENLGIGGNVNRAFALAEGELLVMAAGDDISIPTRVQTIFDAWLDSGKAATSIHSRFSVIDEVGRPVGPADNVKTAKGMHHQQASATGYVRRRAPHVAGCTHAVSRRLFSCFGPLHPKVTYEDTALSFRTTLLKGTFTYIDQPLVRYRRHGGNVTFDLKSRWARAESGFEQMQAKRRTELQRFVDLYEAFAADADRALAERLIAEGEHRELSRQIAAEGRRMELKRDLLVEGWLSRCVIFARLYGATVRPRELIENLPLLLPRCVQRLGAAALTRAQA